MTSHHEPDGTLVVAYAGGAVVWTKADVGDRLGVHVLTLAYDLTLGARGTDRAIGPRGRLPTCFLIALLVALGRSGLVPRSDPRVGHDRCWRWRLGMVPWARGLDAPSMKSRPFSSRRPSGTRERRAAGSCWRLADGRRDAADGAPVAGMRDGAMLGIAGQIRTIARPGGPTRGGRCRPGGRWRARDRRAPRRQEERGRRDREHWHRSGPRVTAAGRTTESAAGLEHVEAPDPEPVATMPDAVRLLRRTTGCLAHRGDASNRRHQA